ncbi:MAG: caspase family protein [Bacteroidales bacterium]|nr:caspase family protein [Bacteroidales bacterium]
MLTTFLGDVYQGRITMYNGKEVYIDVSNGFKAGIVENSKGSKKCNRMPYNIYNTYAESEKAKHTENMPVYAGLAGSAEIEITYPVIQRGFKPSANESLLTVKGRVLHCENVKEVTVNGQKTFFDNQGVFSQSVNLNNGDNYISVKAVGNNNSITVKDFIIERKGGLSAKTEPLAAPVADLPSGKYYALIIGMEDYNDPSINDLSQPLVDAGNIYKALTNYYTFYQSNVTFLKNPTKDEITASLEYYYNITNETDNLLIFYAGHGYWDKRFEQGYWLARDAARENRSTWLSNSTIRDYIRAMQAKHIVLISDACFSGSIFTSRDAFPASKAINQLYKYPSRKAMTSGTLTEVPDKSVFVKYLVKRLEENTEKYLSSEELFSSFKAAVINNSANGQIPQFGEVKETGDEGGDFIFIRQ